MSRQRPFDVPAELYPFEDHWLEHEGWAMHYVDQGEGVPVVMVHGNPTWSFLYRDVIKNLGEGVRALAPDQPGFGMSGHPEGYGFTPPEQAEQVRAWLDSLGLDRSYVLVVQDWGGPVGLSAALQKSEEVAGLVILNTWAWPSDLGTKAFSWAMGGPLGYLLHTYRNFFADVVVRRSMTREGKTPAVYKAYTDPFPTRASRYPTYVFPRAIRQHDAWLAELWEKTKALAGLPVEMVWGMSDLAFGHEAVIAKWQRRFVDAPVTRLPDAKHYLQEDEPEAIAAAIMRVVDGLV